MSPEEMKSFVPPVDPQVVDDALSDRGLDGGNLFDRLSSPFESDDLDGDILQAYVEGRATEDERRMIDAMIEVDPSLKETIQLVRDELELAETWSPPAGKPDVVVPVRPGLVEALRNLFARSTFRMAFQAVLTVGITACLMLLMVHPQPSGVPKVVRPGTDNRALLAQVEEASRQKDATIADLRKQLNQKDGSPNRTPSKLGGGLRAVAKERARTIWLAPSGRVAMDVPLNNPWSSAFSGAVRIRNYPEGDIERGGAGIDLQGKPNLAFVLPDHVTLSWRPPNGSKHATYHITVESDKGRELSYATSETDFPLPIRLNPGAEYRWKVAVGDGPDAPVSLSASFRTLTESETKKAGKILANSRLGPFERAEELAGIGLREEAEREFNRVEWQDKASRDVLHKVIFGR